MIRSIAKLSQKLTQTSARYSYYATLSSIPPQIDEILKITDKLESTGESKLFIKPFGCWLGVSREEVIQEKGKPRYVVKGVWKDLETIIYKQKSKSIETIIQLHFFKGRLFFVKSDFSSIIMSIKELNQLIYISVCKKYQNLKPEDSFHHLMLKDKRNGQLLLVSEGFFSSIYYFNDSIETKELFKRLRTKKEDTSGTSRTSLSHLV